MAGGPRRAPDRSRDCHSLAQRHHETHVVLDQEHGRAGVANTADEVAQVPHLSRI